MARLLQHRATLFINSACCTAFGKLAVDYYRRNAADAELLGFCSRLGLAHVQHFRFARGTCYLLDGLHRFVTRGAAGAKNYISPYLFSQFFQGKDILNPVGEYRVKWQCHIIFRSNDWSALP